MTNRRAMSTVPGNVKISKEAKKTRIYKILDLKCLTW